MNSAVFWCHGCESQTRVNEHMKCSVCFGDFIEEVNDIEEAEQEVDYDDGGNLIFLQFQRLSLNRVSSYGRVADNSVDQGLEEILNQSFDQQQITGSPPASKEIIDNLETIIIAENHIGVHVECTVCKENFSESEKCKVLPCKHLFHGDCIKQWLGIHNTCPICRYEFLTDDKEYELAKQSPKIAFSYFPSLMLPTRTTPSFLTFPTARSLFLSTTPSFLTFPTHEYIRSTIASLTTPILTTTPIPSAPPTPTARLTQAAIFPRTSNLGTEQKMRYNIPNRNKITPRNNDKRNKQIKTNHNNKRYYQPNSNKNTGNKNKNRSNANRKPNRKT